MAATTSAQTIPQGAVAPTAALDGTAGRSQQQWSAGRKQPAPPPRLDGTLRCALSPNNGEGSESMQMLVEQHLTSILRPIGEHVAELQLQVSRLQEDVQAIQAERCTERLDGHDAELATLKEHLASTAASLDRACGQLGDLSMRHRELHRGFQDLISDYAVTKTAVAKVDDHQKQQEEATKQSASNMRGVVAELDSRTIELQRNFETLPPLLERLDGELADLRRSHIGVCERHIALSRSHETVIEDCSTLHDDIHKLHQELDVHKDEVMPIFDELRNHSTAIEQDVSAVQKDVTDLASTVKLEASRTERLQVSAIALRRGIDAVESRKCEKQIVTDLEEVLKNRVYNVETELLDLGRRLAIEVAKNPLSLAQDLAQHLNVTAAAVERQRDEMTGLDERQRHHNVQLRCLDMRTRDLAKEDQMLGAWVDVADVHLNSVVKAQQASEVVVEAHGRALERVSGLQKSANAGIHQANLNIKNLHGTVGAQNDTIAKLSARLELAHEYVDGVGKGLQDTHQQVLTGTGGMLAPKGGAGRVLPEIVGRTSPSPSQQPQAASP
mmetsp:Transcript_31620/g.73767  ORF Transcript_31620/g.73767 Transcript_31620/m.73767 type:complete len:556 (-) Transcript_31620:107-1774(-)